MYDDVAGHKVNMIIIITMIKIKGKQPHDLYRTLLFFRLSNFGTYKKAHGGWQQSNTLQHQHPYY